MTYVVSLTDFTPGPRFDATPWTQARIDYSTSSNGPWTSLETKSLSPLDSDPSNPAVRNFTTALSPTATGWFKVAFLDALGHEQDADPIYSGTVTRDTPESTTELVRQVRDQVGFDTTTSTVTDQDILGWLNAKHRQLVSRTRCFRGAVSLGATVTGQSDYPIPGSVLQVLEVGVGRTQWPGTWRSNLAGLRKGTTSLSNTTQVWAPDSNAASEAVLVLYPTPETGGDDVQLFAILRAPTLTLTGQDPVIPGEFNQALVSGAAAVGLKRIDKRPDLANDFLQEFETAVGELRGQTRARFNHQVTRIQVQGYDFLA